MTIFKKSSPDSRLYTQHNLPQVSTLENICAQTVTKQHYPLSSTIKSNIPVYDLTRLSYSDPDLVNALQDEWHKVLQSGPGVFILEAFFSNNDLLSAVNKSFDDIILQEARNSQGDHFSTSGKNSRIWNSFEKHAIHDATSFVEYYSNPWLDLVSEAWLGPNYQVTAQVNIVRPGGAPQVAHRDYHLGFQTADSCARYPRATQIASQYLTLQGAVAHSDMPLESGPTRFLPFSQQLDAGYMTYRLPEFTSFFNDKWVSAPLRMGDAVFFNPALFHAAGENTTETFSRSANLLQISSAFGRTMESINNIRIIDHCWTELVQKYEVAGMTKELESFINAIAQGYPFPTNLDRRPPAPGGMAPESEADVVRRALSKHWNKSTVLESLLRLKADSQS